MNTFCGAVRWAMLAMSVAAVGCADSGAKSARLDLGSPRLTVAAMDRAISARDYDGIAQCIAPAYRSNFRDILGAFKDYSVKMTQTAAMVEKRIAPEPAARLRREIDDTYNGLLPSPLAGAVKDGKVQWDLVQIQVDKNGAVVEVNHRPTAFGDKFEIVPISGAWYVAPDESDKRFSVDAKRMTKTYRQFIAVLDHVQARVKNSQITLGNVNQELWPDKAE